MDHLLLSAAIGDIAGSVYERRRYSTKDYDKVEVFSPWAHFTDDTVLTFACAEALLDNLDMSANIYKRAREYPHAGYGHRFRQWLANPVPHPYDSYGNGSAMRCSAAGWLAQTEDECISLATATALPTHGHPDGIKGAVAAALSTFYLKEGHDKPYVRDHVLHPFYPQWATLRYADFHDAYRFDSSCEGSVAPAIICFLESTDYIDCIKLAIALGGDADTLAAIAGPMAYAHYGSMPTYLVQQTKEMLPHWMIEVSTRFDAAVNIKMLSDKRQ